MKKRVYVGVDIGKDSLDASIYQKEKPQRLGEFSNNQKGFLNLSQAIEKKSSKQVQIHLVLEPSGGYQLKLVTYAYEQGWLVSQPNPKLVRDWSKGIGRRAKTDPIDGDTLALYGAERKPAPQKPFPDELIHLDDLLKRRLDLEHILRQERNRLHSLQVRPVVNPLALNSIVSLVDCLELQLADLDTQLKAHIKAYPFLQRKLKLLLGVSGIGPRIAPFILLCFYKWHILTDGLGSSKQLTAFLGLDPLPYQSGSSVYKRPSISKMGDATLRSKLYMGALGGVRGCNPLRHFYKGLVGRGKPKKLALVAAARKILVWAWLVFSRDCPFDPKKVYPTFA